MRTLGNIIWHIPFLGFVSAFFTFLLGCFLVITIIGAPIGLGLIQLSKFLLSPYSSQMIYEGELNINQNILWKSYGVIIRILYFPFGLILAIVAIIQVVGLFITIIGIPVAIVVAKSISTFFNPVGKKSVSKSVANELQRRKASKKVDSYLNRP